MTRLARRLSCLLPFALLAGTAVAAGQTTAQQRQNPERAPDASSVRPGLELSWSALTGYDDNVLADTDTSVSPFSRLNGSWQAAESSLRYVRQSRAWSAAIQGRGTGRYYPDAHALNAVEGTGEVALVRVFGAKTHVAFFQRARYRPYFDIGFPHSVPSDPDTGRSDPAALTSRPSRSYDGAIELAEQIGHRWSFDAQYGYRFTQVSGASAPFRWQLAQGAFRRTVTRYAGVRLGYGYGTANDGLLPNSGQISTHNIDLGVEYGRPLSPSRRTAFTFGSGSTLIKAQDVQSVRLLADASIAREISRAWIASIAYHRGAAFVEGFAGPMYADTVRAEVRGAVLSRVDFSSSVAYANGEIGLTAAPHGYTTVSAAGDAHFAITRRASLFVRYDYARYDFGVGGQIPFELSPVVHRQGVRVGVTGSLRAARQ